MRLRSASDIEFLKTAARTRLHNPESLVPFRSAVRIVRRTLSRLLRFSLSAVWRLVSRRSNLVSRPLPILPIVKRRLAVPVSGDNSPSRCCGISLPGLRRRSPLAKLALLTHSPLPVIGLVV